MVDPRVAYPATFWPSFSVFLLAAVVYGEIVVDYIQTVKVLQAGGVELDPIAKWLQSKIGQPGACFAGAGLFTVGLGIFATLGIKYGIIYAAVVAALEGANVIRNIFVMKKMKVSFF